jgi:cytochrome P450
MPTSTNSRRPFDLGDPQTIFRAREQGRLRDLYDQLAREAPLWQLPGVENVYLACTWDLVEEAAAQTRLLSSNLTRMLYRGDDGNPAVYEQLPLDDPLHTLATADPPSHTAHRRLLQPVLSRRAVRGWTGRVTEIADELLDAFEEPTADVASQLADPLTMRVLCNLIGLPEEHTPALVQAVIAMDRLISGLASRGEMDAGVGAALTLGLRLAEYLNDTPPPDTILSALRSLVEDGSLTEQSAVAILLQLVAAGTETTATLIGHAVSHLTRDQEAQNRLRANPAGIPDFLEDVLRDDGPFQFHSRTARAGATLGGTDLPAGSLVLLMWASANQNASALTTAPSDRARTPHLAFGRGIHFCIGAHLARLEAAVSIEVLLRRSRTFTSDRPATSRPSLMMSRPSSVPIRWTSA